MPRDAWSQNGPEVRKLRKQVRENQPVCWRCGGEFPDVESHLDPLAFSVDHVQPKKVFPELALVYGNLRAAHRACNRERGLGKSRTSGIPPSEEW